MEEGAHRELSAPFAAVEQLSREPVDCAEVLQPLEHGDPQGDDLAGHAWTQCAEGVLLPWLGFGVYCEDRRATDDLAVLGDAFVAGLVTELGDPVGDLLAEFSVAQIGELRNVPTPGLP